MTLIELGILDSEITQELKDLEFQRVFLKFVTILVPRIVDAFRRAASAPDLNASIKRSLEEMRSDIAPLGYADAAMEAQIGGFVYTAAATLNLPAPTVRDCMRAVPIAAGDSAALRLQGILRVFADTIERGG